MTLETIKAEVGAVMNELFTNCSEGHYALRAGDIIIIGCSTSRVMGYHMGQHSTEEAAAAIMETVLPLVREKVLFLACQCCEHLNRALVVERECMEKYELTEVSVKPALHAGGAWSVQAMKHFASPVVVEDLRARARAGIDIGGVFIGMHMRPVVVPIHNENTKIGCANVTMARTRPKLIGGERAQY
ncbi:MAG: TIGR01440 family protein [Clostridia bacterium]|nr:TIGR01440 family protein [Clostridia bacterium]